MKPRTLLILAACTAGACAAAWFAARSDAPVSTPQRREVVGLYPSLAARATDIARITIRRAGQETILQRDDTAKEAPVWRVASKGGYEADLVRIRALVNGLAEARIIDDKTNRKDMHARLGVEDPRDANAKGVLVTLEDKAGYVIASVVLGNQSFGGNPMRFEASSPLRFVRRDAEDQAYLAEGDISAEPDPLSWIARNAFELAPERIRSVEVAATKNGVRGTLRTRKPAPESPRFEVFGIPEGRELQDEFAGGRITAALSFVTFDDVRPAGEVPYSETSDTAIFRTFDGLVVTARIAQHEGRAWVNFSFSHSDKEEDQPPQAPAAAGDAAPPSANAPIEIEEPEAKPEPTPAERDAAAKAEKDAREARERAMEKAKAEAAALQARLGGWAFVLPEYRTGQLRTTLEDLLKPAAAPTTDPNAVGPVPLGP